MAATAVTLLDAGLNNFGTQASANLVALDGTDGALIPISGKDGYTVLVFTCSAADATITIKGGNGDKGGQDAVLTELAKDKTAAVLVDSAYFVNVSGTNKGKIQVTGKATTSVMAVELKAGR